MVKPTIYWFRRDLRLDDNLALISALATDKPIILLYIYDESKENQWSIGSASKWWLHHSLQRLSKTICDKGGELILRSGDSLEIIKEILQSIDADSLYFNRQYDPGAVNLEQQIHEELSDRVTIKRYGGYLLFEPEHLRTGKDEPYKVFTPFWRKCLNILHGIEPTAAPEKLNQLVDVHSEKLEDWQLLPSKPDWSTGISKNWQAGEDGAHNVLKEFLDLVVGDYDELRNRPDIKGTSRLSPYLHFGEISPARVYEQTQQALKKNPSLNTGAMSFIRELGWREFSYHLLFHWPHFPDRAFRSVFDRYPWESNDENLQAWQTGNTGYPIVDAGMRQLWNTGWMHNRVRMIVASFLIKDLRIDWREGEKWFWDTLVDADLASNSAGWQWVAGSGADASPYYRIFNPILQGKKFDPNGDYVREWVPEIAALSKRVIHEPWNATPLELAEANVELDETYPAPIVEHSAARDKAMAVYKSIKQ